MNRTYTALVKEEINQTPALRMYPEMDPVKKEKSSAETVDDKQYLSSTPSLNENYVTKFVQDEINQTPVSKM